MIQVIWCGSAWYVDPAMIVAISEASGGGKTAERRLYMQGGHIINIDDSPENMDKILAAKKRAPFIP